MAKSMTLGQMHAVAAPAVKPPKMPKVKGAPHPHRNLGNYLHQTKGARG